MKVLAPFLVLLFARLLKEVLLRREKLRRVPLWQHAERTGQRPDIDGGIHTEGRQLVHGVPAQFKQTGGVEKLATTSHYKAENIVCGALSLERPELIDVHGQAP